MMMQQKQKQQQQKYQDDLFVTMGLNQIGSHVPGDPKKGHTPSEIDDLDAIEARRAAAKKILADPSATPQERQDATEELEELEEQENRIKSKGIKRAKKDKKAAEFYKWQEYVRETVQESMKPLFVFIGQVQVKLGGSSDYEHYRKKGPKLTYEERTSIVKTGYATEREFYRANRVLGVPLLQTFKKLRDDADNNVKKEKETDIGPQIYGRPTDEDIEAIVGSHAQRYSNVWVWSALPNEALAAVLTDSMYSALTMGHARLKQLDNLYSVTLKELVYSMDVRHAFASVVVFFIRQNGGLAFPGRIYRNPGGNTQAYNISVGYKHKDLQAISMNGAIAWFKDVYRAVDPDRQAFKSKVVDVERDPVRKNNLTLFYNLMQPHVLRHSNY